MGGVVPFGCLHLPGSESNGMIFPLSVHLQQHSTNGETGCICVDDGGEVGVQDAEDGGRADGLFEMEEC